MTTKLLKCITVIKRKKLRLLFLVSFGLLLQCTAYFNSFYNGKSAFREGNKAHLKMLRNYPDSTIVKPTDEIAKKYVRAIEKSNKTIELYPKQDRWKDNALLLMGKSYYYQRDNARAINRLIQLQKEYPLSPLIPQTYLYLGKAYFDMEEFDKAEQMLGVILEKYPAYNNDNQVSFLLVEIAIRRGGRAQAISILEKSLKSVRSEEQRISILLRIAEMYVNLSQYQKAITILEKAPRKNDFPQQSFRMDRALFTCYSELGNYEKALSHVDVMLKKRLYVVYRPDLLLMKASIYQRLGRTEEAMAVYKKITEGVDSTNISSDTSTVVGKAFYALALMYQKTNEDYKNSLYYATLASKSKDTTSKIQALHLVSAFNKLKQMRDEKDSTEAQKQKRLFRIGELFRFELSEPDSAYNQFIELAASTPDSQQIVPMALCAAAFIARDEMKDSVRADSLFQLLVLKYPSSEYAKVSQEAMNVPVTVTTRRDSAYNAFSKAETLLYGKEKDVKLAISGFYDVYRDFEDIDIAPKSLFNAAWLIDEVLQKNKTAKDLYERLCKRYPDSYYCTAEASPRLKEVAKALEKSNQNSSTASKPITINMDVKVPKQPDSTVVVLPPEETAADTLDGSMQEEPGKVLPDSVTVESITE